MDGGTADQAFDGDAQERTEFYGSSIPIYGMTDISCI